MKPGKQEVQKERSHDGVNPADTLGFWSSHFFDPDLQNRPELDKNITSTNLKSIFDEPRKVRIFLNAYNILKQYTVQKDVVILRNGEILERSQYEQLKREGKVVDEQVEKTGSTEMYKYPKASKKLLAKVQNLVTTAKARDGFGVKEFGKQRIEREESLEDKSKQSGIFTNMFGGRK